MNRNTIIALVVFVGLIGAAMYVTTRDRSRHISRISLADVQTEAIDKVVFSGKNEGTLRKEGDQWQVELGERSKRADSNMLDRMLEAIPKIVSSELVTSTEARYEELEVNDEKGTRVQVFAGEKVVADFVVGSSASGGTNIRIGEDVYAVKGVYASNFAREKTAWVDKKIFADELDAVEKVTVSLAGQDPYILIKSEDNWVVEGDVLPEGFRFDSNAARRIVSSLVSLRAKDVLDEDPGNDKTGLAAPGNPDIFRFTVKEGDGTVEREVSFGATEEAAVYAKVTGQDDVYTVYESTVKNLRKRPTELREMTMVDVDKDKVTKIEVVGEETVVLEKKGADWSIARASKPIPDEFKLDPAAVTRRLSAFANARAMSVADEVSAAQAQLAKPTAYLTAHLEGGEKVTLAFGETIEEEGRKQVYARGNIDDAIYVVSEYVKNNVTGGLATFEKKDAPGGLGGLDPKALSGLPPDVRKQLEQQMRQKQQQQKLLEQIAKQNE